MFGIFYHDRYGRLTIREQRDEANKKVRELEAEVMHLKSQIGTLTWQMEKPMTATEYANRPGSFKQTN